MNKTQGKIICIQGDVMGELDLKCPRCDEFIDDDEIADVVGKEK